MAIQFIGSAKGTNSTASIIGQSAGDLLIAFASRSNPGNPAQQPILPVGWTEFFSTISGGVTYGFKLAWKIATGPEASSGFTSTSLIVTAFRGATAPPDFLGNTGYNGGYIDVSPGVGVVWGGENDTPFVLSNNTGSSWVLGFAVLEDALASDYRLLPPEDYVQREFRNPGDEDTIYFDSNGGVIGPVGPFKISDLPNTSSRFFRDIAVELLAATITGDTNVVIADVTSVSNSDLMITGNSVTTLSNIGVTFTGDLFLSANLTATLTGVVLTSVADVIISGNLNQTLSDVTALSGSVVGVSGSLTATLASVTGVATGVLSVGSGVVATLADVTLTSDSDLFIVATSTIQLSDVTLFSTSGLGSFGNVELNLDDITLLSDSVVAIASSSVIPLSDVTTTSSTSVLITASFTSTIGDVAAPSDADLIITANLFETLLSVTSNSESTLLLSADADINLDGVTSDTNVDLFIAASFNSTLNDVTVSSVSLAVRNSPEIDECCIPQLCNLDPCTLICHFVNLLPSGPLWDEDKKKVLDRFKDPVPLCVDDVRQVPCLYDDELCTSLVRHSVYTALRLYDALMGALWPAIRESSPATAYDTMDDWLEKLGWVNCFESTCRDPDLGDLTPFELSGDCGAQYCGVDYPKCLSDATKHGILLALMRLRLQPITTVANINMIIEPLNAFLEVIPDTEAICPLQYSIRPLDDTVAEWTRDNCLPHVNTCQAYVEPNNCYQRGLPQQIYPGVMAAECIVRSMLLKCGLIEIKRLCTPVATNFVLAACVWDDTGVWFDASPWCDELTN